MKFIQIGNNIINLEAIAQVRRCETGDIYIYFISGSSLVLVDEDREQFWQAIQSFALKPAVPFMEVR